MALVSAAPASTALCASPLSVPLKRPFEIDSSIFFFFEHPVQYNVWARALVFG